MFKQVLEQDLKEAVHDLGFVAGDIVLSIPENANHGDYSWNGALQLAKQNLKKDYQSPVEIANAVSEKLGHPKYLERVEVAGVGFLNFFIKDESLISVILGSGSDSRIKKEKDSGRTSLRSKRRVFEGSFARTTEKYLVEFAHPNTHKSFHIGHLRNISIGESISRLLDFQGHEVFRVNYGGDIGPHVAKAIWAILKLKDEYERAKTGTLQDKGEFLGKAYAYGSKAYDEDPEVKKEIDEINAKLYAKDSELAPLWEETKLWSIGYFDSVYTRLGTEFDALIWESEIQERGKQIAEENLDRVFVRDEGAIIFPGEKYGLHNRVFITSKGYPTYEGKELGLTEKEQEIFLYDFSIHVVDVQQSSFFEVTTKALEIIDPSLVGKKIHLPYGFVNLTTGKMSSREGNVITSDELLRQIKEKLKENIKNQLDETSLDKIAIAAAKFTYLKYSLISEITFDIEKSVSLQGDSGPYVQYTFARINSLINRATLRQGSALQASDPKEVEKEGIAQSSVKVGESVKSVESVEPEEREVLRKLEYFEAMAEKAAKEFKPNEIALYLLSLTKAFNFFYEKHGILGSKKEEFRLLLSKKVGETIKLGLYLLGIDVVERM